MKTKITKIIDTGYIPLTIAFLIMILLQELGVFSLHIKYGLLIYVLPLLAAKAVLQSNPTNENRLAISSFFIIMAALLFAFGIRLLPVIHSHVPFGYDPGFYKYTMELYHEALPGIPETELATWVKQMFEQGLFVLSDVVHVVTGINALNQINYLFPFFGVLVILPLFVVTRNLFGPKAGVIASLLYAVSYTQYTTFTMFYFKNVIGLILLLLAIYALEKNKDWLTSLMFAALGIFHLPEFFLFALILIPYFIFHKRLGIVLGVLGAIVLIAPFWVPRWEIYRDLLSGGIGGGTFFNFDIHFLVSMAYLPFAVMGAIYLIINKNFNSVLFYFLIACVIVVFQLIFFYRFIIMFDLAVVILASAGICYTLLNNNGTRKVLGVIAIILVIVASALPTVKGAIDIRPHINERQLKAIEWINSNTESNAYVLCTSSDAPWVLGWSGRRVIAPGLFEWYIQSKEDWFYFLDSTNPETAREFVEVYDSPVYVYYSKNSGNYLPLEKFQSIHFEKVYDDGSATIYKYLGGS